MARETKRLTARTVATLTSPGSYADGDGLYLVVGAGGAKRWEFRFRMGRKSRLEMGLGKLSAVSLAEAREKATEARKQVDAGINPIEARRQAEREAELEKARGTTFGEFADELVADLSAGFRNEKHKWQWGATLKTFAASLRDKRLAEVDTEMVLAVLRPIWLTKSETASRLRGRIERVLDAAKAKGLRKGENPARWRGHLDNLLPRRHKLTRGHHPAMPYSDIPSFLPRLREVRGVGAIALEFTILTSARSGEVIGARWHEIDFDNGIWTVPGERMKAGREHRVPLPPAVIELLRKVHETRRSEFVFPGSRTGSSISNMTMLKALRSAGGDAYTVHGFRSAFRDWCGEETTFPREVAEAALAHVVGDEVERAYRRGDALAKRRRLMEAWANFCVGHDHNVVELGISPRLAGQVR